MLGPEGRPGLEMDGTRQVWKYVTSANWLGTRDDQQLMGLREYNASLSGTQQAVNLLLYGSAMHVLPRRLAVAGTLAQQEQPVAAIHNGIVNTQFMKALLTRTHTSSHNWELCVQDQYSQLISMLEDTAAFLVDGRQFRMWVELLPPTEAHPGGDECRVPSDDDRTSWNESAVNTMRDTCGRSCSIIPLRARHRTAQK